MKDIFVRASDVNYSVPPGFTHRRAAVRLSLSDVWIYIDGDVIAQHRRSYVPADVVLDPSHARALRLQRNAARRLSGSDVVVPAADLTRYDALVGLS